MPGPPPGAGAPVDAAAPPVEEDAAVLVPAGAAEAFAAAFDFFDHPHPCLAGEAEAPATGDPSAVAVAAVFFECLWCLDGLGEAAGVGLDAAVWANTDETERTVKMIRGRIFFMTMSYHRKPRGRNG